MKEGSYPYSLEFIRNAAQSLDPIIVPIIRDYYSLALGITTACNFRCPICYYHTPNAPISTHEMSISLLKHLLANMPRLSRIIIGLEGEPFLHTNFADVIGIISSHCREIVIISNGSILDYSYLSVLTRYNVTQLILSIDAGDAEHYQKFRQGGNLNIFRQHTKSLLSAGIYATFHATVYKENLSSLLLLPKLASELGIPTISLQQMRPHSGATARGVQPTSLEDLESWLLTFMKHAEYYGITILPDRNFGGSRLFGCLRTIAAHNRYLKLYKNLGSLCQHIYIMTCIFADGRLFPCAGDYKPIQPAEYSFNGIFNHPYLTLLRAIHKQGILTEVCRVCMNEY